MNLSIIIPAHNEEEIIGNVINRIENSIDIPFELLVVNDHSTDDTVKIAESLSRKHNNLRLVENKLERGFANAIRTGFSKATGEVLVPIMADLCDDLSTVKVMFQEINEGYDVVCGARCIRGGARLGGSRLKGLFSSFIGWSLYYLLGVPTHDITNAFKMYRKKVIDSIEITAKGFEISMELALKAYYAGFRITEIPTVWKERTKGKSTFKMWKLSLNYFRLWPWAILKRLTSKRTGFAMSKN
jgi:glycosyltransferase involved in cell wall biosynthesis